MAQYITFNSNQFDELIDAIENSGGGGGNVSDVYVNGVSVLDSEHIAQIKTHKVLTQSEFNALSNSERDNGIIYLVRPDTPTDYTYHPTQDGKIVVRENTRTNELLCFFCGYNNQTGADDIPADISTYIPSQYNGAAQNYTNSSDNIQDGWGGFNADKIKLWTSDWGALVPGTMWGVVDLNQTGQQSSQYSDPYDIITGEFYIYCSGYIFASYILT